MKARPKLSNLFSSSSEDANLTSNIAKTSKPSTDKTKQRARTMARLINSHPSWSESSLPSSTPLSRTLLLQVLRFIKVPSKALDFFTWAHKQPGVPHSHHPYFLMLEILGRSRNLNPARNFLFSIERRSNGEVKLEDSFFNSLIRNYGQAGLFQESLKLFSLMKSMGVSPSAVTFNSLFMVLVKRGRFGMVDNLFDEMLKTYGVSPDVYTFNILIRGFCKNSMVDHAFRAFSDMPRFGCEPDVVTYNTIVDGLCREGKVRIAHNVVRGMIKRNQAGSNLEPNVVTYTCLVRGYCVRGDIDEALTVFNEMVGRGIQPGGFAYNTLLKGLCEGKKVDKIKEILEGAIQGGEPFTPDTCTFNTLMDAHCRSGNLSEALKMLEEMKRLNVSPDSATYSVLIRSLCQKGDFKRAEHLFDEVSDKEIVLQGDGCTPLVTAYRPMFEFLCKNGKTGKAERVFRQLMKRGTQDPLCFKILIMGHCREGTYEAAYELLVLMLRRDFKPDFDTYESLIDGLLRRGEALLARQTLEKMLKSSHLPQASTFHSLLAGLLEKKRVHESASFLELMLENNVRQSKNLSTTTVQSLFNRGQRDKAFKIIHKLYNKGYMLEMEELVSFLVRSRRLTEAQKILRFCLDKDHDVHIEVYNNVIEGLCEVKKLPEAFDLFYELADKGYHRQLRCLDQLRIALEKGQNLEEARFVAKRMSDQLNFDKSVTTSSRIQRCQRY